MVSIPIARSINLDAPWGNSPAYVLVVETAHSHPGIGFLQNGFVSCAHLGLCLGNDSTAASKLIRQPGASDLDWLDVLDY